MKRLQWLMPIIVATLLVGCYAQLHIYTDQVRDVNMASYKNYAWLPSPDTGSSQIYDNEILQSNLMAEIDDQLKMRGYQFDGKDPDLLVLLHIMFEEEEEVYRSPLYSSYDYIYPRRYIIAGYPYYYNAYHNFTYVEGFDIDTVNYTVGTVVVDLIEAKTGKLVWRGWSERMINADNYKTSLSRDVKAIFKEFPVKANKGYSSVKPVKELKFYQLVGSW